jgi:hypothetical protein
MSASGFIDGLALAATLAGDRGGDDDPTEARRLGLPADIAVALDARLAAIRNHASRERALVSIVGALRPAIDPAAVVLPRVAALLAPEVPRPIGVRWMAAAPIPRAGFRAPASLRAQVRRFAHRAPDGESVRRDRGAGRAALCDAARGQDAAWWQRSLAQLPADEAAAVVALAALPGGPPGEAEDPTARARRTEFVAAVLDAGGGAALTEALGAMERGAREGACSPADRWARAGREIEELRRRSCPA